MTRSVKLEKISSLNHELAAKVFQEAFNYVGQNWSETESIKYVERIAKYACSYVAILEGAAVGIIAADIKDDHLFVDAIGVSPKHMKEGIATLLWNQAKSFAKQSNISIIKMIADPKSLAYSWYEKLGFSETGWVELLLEIGKE
ncbi:hypothetical protein CO112_01940 [Candidatus Dojkabacteria bacterium CG_4_9_14_3_um_filter_150_Dojkabacteria_WS6_41_13]|nr:MAG: hypothetical protein COZ14_04520 [Candidatus Dojkabacteria bacterium CG_4_10_14_3_um_filter_Dojkabacteria_WS6_41_9]PJB22894.1 MAG: hypothetical protein CO112_01940 [Candidatus Dojkabacteria bacterium CG_4_9_14_3_um_filter_150_Dojkabacteria_WS6_41_13]